ncbi:MAG: hypothetical protein QOC81_606 [Thermoanaerobaculia bacterium]|jgi:hypothetical protein|nr:hypothetical protein [Thermoanaerobaculia bacterium]
MKTRPRVWLVVPLLVALAGVVWMQAAVSHYRRTTGRAFYGLAGYHYSSPEWGFEYYPGGERIHRWTTIIPPYTTLIVLGISLVLALAVERKESWRVLAGIVLVHLVTAAAFALVAGWYDINVTGVFI